MKLQIDGLLNCTDPQELKELLGDRYVNTVGNTVCYKISEGQETSFSLLIEPLDNLDEILIIDNIGYVSCISVPKGSVEVIDKYEPQYIKPSFKVIESDVQQALNVSNTEIEEDKSIIHRTLDIIEIYAKKK